MSVPLRWTGPLRQISYLDKVYLSRREYCVTDHRLPIWTRQPCATANSPSDSLRAREQGTLQLYREFKLRNRLEFKVCKIGEAHARMNSVAKDCIKCAKPNEIRFHASIS